MIKDRIKELMDAQHMNQQSFSDLLGISAASLSSIFNDRTRPTLNHIGAIKKSFPSINLDWLLYGKGPMFLAENSSNVSNPVQPETIPNNQYLDFESSAPTPQTVTKIENPSLFDQKESGKTQPAIVRIIDKKPRSITEIRVFYDDQTWESFYPNKEE